MWQFRWPVSLLLSIRNANNVAVRPWRQPRLLLTADGRSYCNCGLQTVTAQRPRLLLTAKSVTDYSHCGLLVVTALGHC